jgi:hypothetical protein
MKINHKRITFILGVLMFVMLACGIPSLGGDDEEEQPVPPEEISQPTNTPTTIPAPPTQAPPTVAPPPTEAPTLEPPPTIAPPPLPPTVEVTDYYYTEFQTLDDWDFYFAGSPEEYTVQSRPLGLFIEVPLAEDWMVGYSDFYASDVRLDADVELVDGTNSTYIGLICRSTEDGEYYFYLDTGGYWQIGYWDYASDEYVQLGTGGTKAIRVAKNPNHVTAICKGDTFTFIINNQTVGTVKDHRATEGFVGIDVETFDFPYAAVYFHNFEASIP